MPTTLSSIERRCVCITVQIIRCGFQKPAVATASPNSCSTPSAMVPSAFSPFGVDQSGWNIFGDEPWHAHARNFALIAPMSREIAQLEFEGKLKTAVEEPGQTAREVDFGQWQATVAFGFPQPDGRRAPGTKDAHAAALIAQLGPDEFLITGVDASISFHLPGKLPWMRSEIITAEQGAYQNGEWKLQKLWNGDETDRGLCFQDKPEVVRVR